MPSWHRHTSGTPPSARTARQLFEQACRVLPGGSTRSVLDFSPFSFRVAQRRGLAARRRRRPRVHRLPRRLLGGPARPRSRPGGRGGPRRARARLELRRHPRRRDPSGRARLPALPVDRPGALHELGHRGEPDGAPARPPLHRARPHRRVRRRVPRRLAVLRPRRRGAPGAVRLRAPAVQRPRRRARRPRQHGRRRRGADRRTDDGRGRLHPGRTGIPRRAPRRLRSHRGAVDLRRGDDVAHELRRGAAALGRAPRPDDVGQVPRRWDDVRRVRRARRSDGRPSTRTGAAS